MSKLNIASGFSLPLDFVTKTIAILAQRRKGKTYTASVLAEELITAKVPVVVLDPTGAWWGLRASADGKSEGLPVVILGGQHGDLPLERSAGVFVADLAVDHPGHYVIDFSLFESAEAEREFATAFAQRLYRRKAHAGMNFPMHLIIDEADRFIPQRVPSGDQTMLGAFETIVRRGGLRGLGTTVISQRAAVVNKNVLEQIDTLIVLRNVGPNDQAAILDYVKAKGTPEEMKEIRESMASLELGEAWVWEPGSEPYLFKRIKIRARHTFNSSATPEAGKVRVEPKHLAAIDIEAIKSKMSETIKRAKENDPRELKRQIADLKRQLANVPTETVTKEVLVADPAAVLAAVNGERKRIQQAVEVVLAQVGECLSHAERAIDSASEIKFVMPAVSLELSPKRVELPSPRTNLVPPSLSREQHASAQRHGIAVSPPVHGETSLSGGAKKLVSALLAYPDGLTRGQARILCGFAERTLTNYVSEMNGSGLLIKGNGTLKLNPGAVKDLAYLGTMEVPDSTRAVLNLWRERVSGGAYKLLEVLVHQKGEPVLREQAMQACEFAERTLTNYVSELSTAGLLVRSGQGTIAANKEALFL